jgi:hypothetical protein
MSAVLEQMIAEAEMSLTALQEIRERFRAMKEPSPLIKGMMERNEAAAAEWERRLGELNRCLMTRRLLETAPELPAALKPIAPSHPL